MPQNRAPHFARHSWLPQNCSTLGTPYTIQTHDDGFCCQQVLSLSPECWTKMIMEEIAVVGSVYSLSLRDSVVQYHSINATMNIAFTLLCVGRTVFGRGEPGCFHSFDCRFKCGSYERSQVSSRVTILPRKSSPSLCYRFNKSCAVAYRCYCSLKRGIPFRTSVVQDDAMLKTTQLNSLVLCWMSNVDGLHGSYSSC